MVFSVYRKLGFRSSRCGAARQGPARQLRTSTPAAAPAPRKFAPTFALPWTFPLTNTRFPGAPAPAGVEGAGGPRWAPRALCSWRLRVSHGTRGGSEATGGAGFPERAALPGVSLQGYSWWEEEEELKCFLRLSDQTLCTARRSRFLPPLPALGRHFLTAPCRVLEKQRKDGLSFTI